MPMIHLVVGPPPVSDTTKVRWITDPGQSRVGEKKRIILEGFFTGAVVSVLCPVPEKALLLEDDFPAVASEKGWTVINQWYWTPLEEGSQTLPAALVEFALETGGTRSISSAPYPISVAASKISKKTSEVSESLLRAFSELPPVDQEKQIDRAAVLRIAELRHKEYVSFFPSHYRKERESIEKDLFLIKTRKVPYAAWKALSVIGSIAFLFIFLGFYVISQRRSFWKHFAQFTATGAIILTLFAVYIYTTDRQGAGVVLTNHLSHVPENESSIITEIIPGSSVKILKRAGNWVYVETLEPTRGWLQSDLLIEYTTNIEILDEGQGEEK